MQKKRWIVLIALLVLCNMASLGYFWWTQTRRPMGPPPMPGGARQPSAFLITAVGFDSLQIIGYQKLIDQHRSHTQAIRAELGQAKEAFFAHLAPPDIADSNVKAAYNPVETIQWKLDSVTFSHFAAVRLLCRPEQQQKFDAAIGETLKLMARTNGGDRPPNPQTTVPENLDKEVPMAEPKPKMPVKQLQKTGPPPHDDDLPPPGAHPPGPPPPGAHLEGPTPPGGHPPGAPPPRPRGPRPPGPPPNQMPN